ncbi:MAG TPA: EAL domain-containing protein [Gaiellales bacterium]|jgi:diguanylate cyclase (GGDEF)-like protein/PAS domain S-box-containing protein
MSPDKDALAHAGMLRLGVTGTSVAVFRALAERASVGVFVLNALGECDYANERACELTGLSLEQLYGRGWTGALHPSDVDGVLEQWASATASGESLSSEHRFLRPDGRVSWVEVVASPVHDAAGVLLGWAGTVVDMTDRKLGEARYAELFEHASDAVVTLGPAGDFISVNRAAEIMTGYGRDELAAMSMFDFIAPQDAERIRRLLSGEVERNEREIVALELIGRDGRRAYIEVSARRVVEHGSTVRIEAIARDTTERRELEGRLDHQAVHDALTGLPNRLLLVDRLEQSLARSRRGDDVVVMLLDLDNFKLVNDSLGHMAGDRLLVTVAERLRAAVPEICTTARVGADEFVLLLDGVEGTPEVVALAERILAVVAEPFPTETGPAHLGASIGIAFAEGEASAESLLANGETAMHRAKRSAKGGFELFDRAMRARVRRHMAVVSQLRQALEDGALDVHYQPIVAIADGAPLAVEALIRWPHAEWGWVQPSEFIPLAEDNGLIVPLGDHVLGEVARQIAAWRREYPGTLPVGAFANVSPYQLSQPDFVPKLTSLLDRHGLAAADLGIEITEGVFLDENDSAVTDNIAELARIGVPLSLDDFGTGYSALASLKRFPFASLKIDGYFIGAITQPTHPAPITTAIVGLGRALGVTVIAERVETAVQLDRLRSLGCDAGQGYLFARPQPAQALDAILAAAMPGDGVGRAA